VAWGGPEPVLRVTIVHTRELVSMAKSRSGRVALFLPSLAGGGAERVMVNIANCLAERGMEVDMVLVDARGPLLDEVSSRVRMVNLKSSRTLTSLPKLVGYLRRVRPGAMLSALTHANIVAILAGCLSRVSIPIVVSVHNTVSVSTVNTRGLRPRLCLPLMRRLFPRAAAVVAVSEGVAEDLLRITSLSQEKVRVIYNPVITPQLFTKAAEPVAHPWYRPGEPPVILAAGRLTKQKDFPTLIRAFALVRKKMPTRLMILGEGEDRPKLEALVRELDLEEEVALPGYVDNPYGYMKHAGVFVLSSRWEGFGIVLVEAMALGTPVISTDCPSGPAEILADGKWGRLVPVGDINGMSKAIVEALSEPASRVPPEAWSRFTLEATTQRYLELLLQVQDGNDFGQPCPKHTLKRGKQDSG